MARRRLGTAGVTTCLLVSLLACGESAQGRALGFVRRTIPSAVSMPSKPHGDRNAQSVSYVWDFETHMSPSDYTGWIREQVKDFQVIESTVPGLHFAKLVAGDEYRLTLTIESGAAAGTHVHGQLIASPD